jgi:chitosanase
MLTEIQKKACQAIVNIFETGSPQGNYSSVTVAKNDPGHLTYGRSQTTLASEGLYQLIRMYCNSPTAQFKTDLEPYLTDLQNRDVSLDLDKTLHGILKKAGNDPVMQKVQDEFFDKNYWMPALKIAESAGIKSALGIAVVYDSKIHGSWTRIFNRTNKEHGDLKTIGEKKWIAFYVEERREWIRTHLNKLLQKTVYRMDTFRELIKSENWDLKLPIKVRGVDITGK